MDLPNDAVLLRIFTSVTDRWKMGPLYFGIIEKAREHHLAGATVLKGSLGFGRSAQLHQGHVFSLTQDLPVVIEIVDSEENISSFLPVLDEMMESGLVTIEKAKVLRFGRRRADLVSRFKQQLDFGHATTAPTHPH